MDNQNLPARPKVVYSESNELFADMYSKELTDLGMQVVVLESNLLVAEYLQKNKDVAAVILRNESFGPDTEKGLTIASQLIQNEGFSNPVIVLTGAFSKDMTESIPVEYQESE